MPRFATTVDVLVVGAGPAGMAAAVAASRQGMKTLIVEAEDAPGGALSSSLHTVICGLYSDRPVGVADTLNPGIQREAAVLAAKAQGPIGAGKTYVLPFDMAKLRGWFEATPELDIRYGFSLSEVRVAAARAESAIGATGESIGFGALIDCTGDAVAARLAGTELIADPPHARQLAGYALKYENLSGDLSMLPLSVPYYLGRAASDGALPEAARFAAFALTGDPGEGVCKLAVPLDLAARPGDLRRYVAAARAVLRDKLPAMRDASVTAESPRAVPRDGPRLRGRVVLGEDDILSARKAGSHAVRAAWPIEFWHPIHGPSYAYPPPGDFYEIPPECLSGVRVRNLFCAGRCLSATARAAASARVAGIGLALGEAAAREAVASAAKG